MASSPGHDLQRAAPESQGIASSAVHRFVEAMATQSREIHSVMLLRHGKVIAEGWWSPYSRDHPHMLFSLSKSFTSTAVGLAVAEGHFSIDDPVLSFVGEERPAEVGDLLAAMSVRHLLTMSTGQAVDTWSTMVDRADGSWIRGFLEVPVVYEPGSHFVYNTGATYMLSAIVQKTTGMKLIDYLQPRLFAPLGIENAFWQESPQGITAGGLGLRLKTEDVARFGQLYLQKGVWQGAQLLPEAWVEAAAAAQVSNRDGVQMDWSQGYGYQFWRCRHGAYRGDGVFGQYCIVMPEQDAVLAITSGIDVFEMQEPLNLLWEILLPAMQPGSLPEDAAAHHALLELLSNLRLDPAQGQSVSPTASRVSGRAYAAAVNALEIEAITLDFNGTGCTVHMKTAAGEETLVCGDGLWLPNPPMTLFRQPLLFDRTPCMASGAWSAEDTYTILVRLHETPFCHTLNCHFAGDELLIEVKINVSLESLKPHLLLASLT